MLARRHNTRDDIAPPGGGLHVRVVALAVSDFDKYGRCGAFSARNKWLSNSMVIDIHAHYVPASLIAEIESRGASFGVAVARPAGAATPALHFNYGFKVRPFFPKLVETADERRAWLDTKKIDRQIVATWP